MTERTGETSLFLHAQEPKGATLTVFLLLGINLRVLGVLCWI
jgi:hypothetical protein